MLLLLCVCMCVCWLRLIPTFLHTHPNQPRHPTRHVAYGSQGLVPEENKASEHVMAALAPHSKEQGGPLLVRVVLGGRGRRF